MKKTILGLFLGMSVMGMAATGVGLNEDVSSTLNISAEVVATLTITEKTPMNFGIIVAGVEATTTGEMEVKGAKKALIKISYDKDNTTISRAGETDNIKVQLSSDHANAQTNLDQNGDLIETIKGTISGGAITQPGTYSGSVSISVRYE